MSKPRERYVPPKTEDYVEEVKVKKPEVTFTHCIYDVIKTEQGKFEIVKLRYNLDSS
jgi:hypothetical protein